MNAFTLHADGGIICLLCSKHPGVTTGQGKNGNIYTTNLPGLHAQTAWIIISALINPKKPIAWKKNNALPIHVIHQDRISDKVNTVAGRVHLIYWVFKERANRKIASLQPRSTALATVIGFASRDLRYTSSVAVSTLYRVKTKQRNRLLDVTLRSLINVSINGPDRTIARKSSIEGLYVWARDYFLKIDENHWLIMFHISILGVLEPEPEEGPPVPPGRGGGGKKGGPQIWLSTFVTA